MTDGEALLRAILANPACDTARLVYADWLQENGSDPLAHWIRARVASPDVTTVLGPSDSVSAFGGIVARGVRAFAGKGVYPNGKLFFRRGFAEAVESTSEMWIAHADAITAAHPVERVTLTTFPLHLSWRDTLTENEQVQIYGRNQWVPAGADNILRALAAEWPRIAFTLPSGTDEIHTITELYASGAISRETVLERLGLPTPAGDIPPS